MAITAEQLKARRGWIGSSDVPAIMGVSPWSDEHEVRASKLGLLEEDEEQSPEAEVGTLMEPVMCEILARRLKRSVQPGTETMHHERYKCLAANLDAFVLPAGFTDGRQNCKVLRGLDLGEFKVSGIADGWGEPGTDQVPLSVVFQTQHQMACTDAPCVHVVRMFPDPKRRRWAPMLYCVPRDEGTIASLVDYLVDWYAKHVERREPIPERDRLPLYDVQTSIMRDEAQRVEVASDLFVATYRATQARKAAEEAEKAAKAKLLAAMGDAGVATTEFGEFALRVENAGRRVDNEQLKTLFPDVYAKVSNPSTRKMPRWKLNPAGKRALEA